MYANYGSIPVRAGQGRFQRQSLRKRILDKLVNRYGRHHGEPDSEFNARRLLRRIALADGVGLRFVTIPRSDATMELQLVRAA